MSGERQRKVQLETSRSLFANALRRLLDESGRFDRTGWARALGVSTAAISQWVNDRTLPRAELVRLIVAALRPISGDLPTVLKDFLTVAQRPAEEVTPLFARLGADDTIAAYMVKPIRDSFLRLLATIPPAAQEIVLFEACELCAKYFDADSGWTEVKETPEQYFTRIARGFVPDGISFQPLDQQASPGNYRGEITTRDTLSTEVRYVDDARFPMDLREQRAEDLDMAVGHGNFD